MTTATTDRNLCDTCGKAKGISKCEGCAKNFCYNHFGDHRHELNKQLDEIGAIHDLYRQTLTEQTLDPRTDALIQQIDEWETDSIKKIQKTAEEARQILLRHTNGHIKQIEGKLNKLTDQLQQSRQENDFVETDLHQWKEQLTQLSRELTNSSNIILRQDSDSLVTKIYVDISIISLRTSSIDIPSNAKWAQNALTVAGGNGQGNRLDQLNCPWSLYVVDDQTIYIADYCNHRIVAWEYGAKTGQVVAGGNGQGDKTHQLNYPLDVIVDKQRDSLIICDGNNKRVIRWPRRNGASGETTILDINCFASTMDENGFLYVVDSGKDEVRRYRIDNTKKIVVAGGNGCGNRLDQLDDPRFLFVDQHHSVYVSDRENQRVMKWEEGAKQGIIVAGGEGEGNSFKQFSSPEGVVVDQLGTIYVADCWNNRIMCWLKGATQGSVIAGGNGQGGQSNQLDGPMGLSFDRHGNLYVVDSGNH